MKHLIIVDCLKLYACGESRTAPGAQGSSEREHVECETCLELADPTADGARIRAAGWKMKRGKSGEWVLFVPGVGMITLGPIPEGCEWDIPTCFYLAALKVQR